VPEQARRNATTVYVAVTVLTAAVLLAAFALREYIAPDYRVEQVPAWQALADGGFGPFIDRLPGYAGAMFVQLIPIATPLALPQTRMPQSNSPRSTASATGWAKSG